MDSYAGIYLTGDKSLTALLTGEIWVAGVFDGTQFESFNVEMTIQWLC